MGVQVVQDDVNLAALDDRRLPLRGASATPAKPCRANRPRHLLTVAGRVASRPAVALLLSPSAKARMICVRNARRCSVFPAASQDCKVARCSLVKTTSAALIPAD